MEDHASRPLGRVLVIIPTYNEAENIKPIVGRVRAAVPDAHILVADDNSPDGTGKLADELAAEDDQVHVLHRKGKEGLGAAYLAGFRWGMEHGYGVLVEMDADGSHQPEELPRLLTALEGADLVLGSRWVPGGRVVNWPKSREFLSRGGSTYSRLLLDVPMRDVTGGYRAFRARDPGRPRPRRRRLAGLLLPGRPGPPRRPQPGYHVVEVPITFVERELGDQQDEPRHRGRGALAGHPVGHRTPRRPPDRPPPLLGGRPAEHDEPGPARTPGDPPLLRIAGGPRPTPLAFSRPARPLTNNRTAAAIASRFGRSYRRPPSGCGWRISRSGLRGRDPRVGQQVGQCGAHGDSAHPVLTRETAIEAPSSRNAARAPSSRSPASAGGRPR